jgi:transposase-like protein
MDSMPNRNGSPPKGTTASSLREASREDQPGPRTPKRVFSAAFKQRILQRVDELGASGERGAVIRFLRQQGLYWTVVKRWQAQRDEGGLASLEPKKRGPKPVDTAESKEVERLRRQVERLQADLRKAEIIIDVQKKLSALLGLQTPTDEDEKP